MKMNKILKTLSLVGIAMAMASCDNIAEGDRLVYVPPVDVVKHVLIEDFTGQRCRNCPDATEVIEEIQNQYGADKVIAVGIYSGPFGKTMAGQLLPLTTQEGDDYFNALGIEGQPNGWIDRRGDLSSNYLGWLTKVEEYMQHKPTVLLEVSNQLDADSRNLTVEVETEGIEDVDNAKLQVWLVEDNIVSPQILPTGKTNSDYVHNHVFRKSVNGMGGEAISVKTGVKVSKKYSVTLNETWKTADMSLITFVYTNDGVQQVEKTPLIQFNGEE